MATLIKGKNKNKPYTVRYYYDGKQREKSFKRSRDARDFMAKFEHDSRERIFVDPRAANEKFGDVAAAWLLRHPGTPKTKATYEQMLRLHILPALGHASLANVANDRDGVYALLRNTLPDKDLGASSVRTCYIIISAIVNDAIKSGKLNQSRLHGIKLPALPVKAEIPMAGRYQIETIVDCLPEDWRPTVYLMRGCGLRIGEALGVQDTDVSDVSLRLKRQLSPDGHEYIPLKHRNADDYRDIPVPKYVLEVAGGWSCPQTSQRMYRKWFNRARDQAGLPDTFTPHTLRHIFASNCLAGGVPITDVSKWLGHRNIQVTYGIYGHLVPASWDRARGVLDEEWAE